jgi:hypothetical protein
MIAPKISILKRSPTHRQACNKFKSTLQFSRHKDTDFAQKKQQECSLRIK